MEIERKFLIKDISKLNLSEYESKKIIQDYLYKDKFTTIRKRHIIKENKDTYIYTVKTGRVKYAINEIEKEITLEQYNSLSSNTQFQTIEKTRYNIPYKDGLIIELDVFERDYKGIIFAEIEFESEEQAENAKFPEWFGKELTREISNAMMAEMKVEDIKNKIGE